MAGWTALTLTDATTPSTPRSRYVGIGIKIIREKSKRINKGNSLVLSAGNSLI